MMSFNNNDTSVKEDKPILTETELEVDEIKYKYPDVYKLFGYTTFNECHGEIQQGEKITKKIKHLKSVENKIYNFYFPIFDVNDTKKIKKKFYIMYCSDGSLFYFSKKSLEYITKHTWYHLENGYFITDIYVDNKKYIKFLHKTICRNEYGEKDDDYIIDHIDGYSNDNRIENLHWVKKDKFLSEEYSRNKQIKSDNKVLEISIDDKDLPKYISYKRILVNDSTNKNYVDFFRIENHPVIGTKNFTKSNKISIEHKLGLILDILNDELYNINSYVIYPKFVLREQQRKNKKKHVIDEEECYYIMTYHFLLGLFYGYPVCCILNYIKCINFKEKNLKLHKICVQASNDTDFIPCYQHSKEIINNEIKLSDVIIKNNRKNKSEFPIEDEEGDETNENIINNYDYFQEIINYCVDKYLLYKCNEL